MSGINSVPGLFSSCFWHDVKPMVTQLNKVITETILITFLFIVKVLCILYEVLKLFVLNYLYDISDAPPFFNNASMLFLFSSFVSTIIKNLSSVVLGSGFFAFTPGNIQHLK